ncbi:HAMP domain-containing histidine kinase [Paenibacillus sp. GSMTC-2017]|uniref:HAMP domain-containing sensor histidine kinase n=1 Tax=Paenibacillus sp. GSMTC-2017 TaxID=2794350 RepID=UPI0018D5CC50|nr:HAMP domain-containing sensor histidine kinase [Paenibacillus sp. GSMTC-2017]MBH5316545.1 HAMP domain-containing histidine kinase [Paenibacillus sp. GSMTC-2017]
MSIRVKLYMSYLAMAFVPVILMILLMLLIFFAGGKLDMREFTEAQRNENFNQALIYGELSYVISDDTEKLEDPVFVHSVQQKLSDQWAGLIITKDGIVTEVSPYLTELSPNENWQQLVDNLEDEYSFKLYRFTAHPLEVVYSDGSKGSVVLLHRTEQVPIFWHPLSMALGLLLVLLTSLLLTYYVSRSIIRPIQSLRTAALRIKEGDLSDELDMGKLCKTTRLTEISQLSSAFEEMRIRLKLSIDQSLQYEENRKLLLSHITHDLKTPISAIKGYVEGIVDGIANTEEKRVRYMQTIYRKATDMDQLIDELFLYTKLDLQKVAYDFKVVDLNRYMEQFIDEQRFEMDKEGVELRFTPKLDAPLLIAADLDKLNRVLANILHNSLKYMVHQDELVNPIISIVMTEHNGNARIIIDDTGPGIDENDLPYIFDGFYRAEQSRNSEMGGSGLGLAIVKQIIEGHGGFVWAENKEEGGARICLELPITTAVRTVNEHEEHTNH